MTAVAGTLYSLVKGGGTIKIKRFLLHFVIVFAITFVVNAIIVYLWNLIRHGEGAFNWETTFFFAIVLGIVFPLLETLRSRT